MTDRLDRLHGDNGKYGRKKWCRGCMKWVRHTNWQEHKDCGDYRIDIDASK